MALGQLEIKGTIAGVLTGTTVGLLGFFLAEHRTVPAMGWVMFVLVPMAAGFAMALVAGSRSLFLSACLSVIGSLGILIATGREGILCAILAFPWLAVCLVIGCGLGLLFKRILYASRNRTTTTLGILCALPFMVVGGRVAEESHVRGVRVESISTSIAIPAEPGLVWSSMQVLDSLAGPKPWLMDIGLPIPVRCTMQGHGLGAKRTCYFESGQIEETVTEWQPPYRMGLHIDRTQMPGRHWMDFEDAAYMLEPQGAQIVLTRTTTITSRLYPAWYWRRFEQMGIESEHRYILNNIAAKSAR
jgi:hypothetical protein